MVLKADAKSIIMYFNTFKGSWIYESIFTTQADSNKDTFLDKAEPTHCEFFNP